uniref:Beta-galactosidase n=1 Tax=Astatotilapia calliptera TaxID=8154 RepID=A0AAX7SVU8_ASTCA
LGESPSFTVDYQHDCFRKDGEKFQYISGSIHYNRIPRVYWKDRLLKMYMAGLNAIQTYIPWNYHEALPGLYNFSGDRDLEHFLKLAQDIGLLVILRPGPYICAEWDMGGLPAWLLKKKDIVLRSTDSDYIAAVDKWMGKLLPMIKPYLYQNGGPIITVQVENEYGSYFACDYNYMRHLSKLTETSSTSRAFGKGRPHNVLTAWYVFSLGAHGAVFNSQVNSEFYTGWLDHWGSHHSVVSPTQVAKVLSEMLLMGANVNLYMFIGGTNFGYWNGANMPYAAQPTSYDYDAPLTEAGDLTEKYFAIREVIKMVRTSVSFYFYKNVIISAIIWIFFTDFFLFLLKLAVGILERDKVLSINVTGKARSQVDILVENMGRVNYGKQINDFKGLVSNLTLGADLLTDWTMYSLSIDEAVMKGLLGEKEPALFDPPQPADLSPPAFYGGSFVIPDGIPDLPQDTYIKLSSWRKGQIWINGFNVGRYWPTRGPQMTLFVPANILSTAAPNNVTVLELEGALCGSKACTVEFTNTPILNATVQSDYKQHSC